MTNIPGTNTSLGESVTTAPRGSVPTTVVYQITQGGLIEIVRDSSLQGAGTVTSPLGISPGTFGVYELSVVTPARAFLTTAEIDAAPYASLSAGIPLTDGLGPVIAEVRLVGASVDMAQVYSARFLANILVTGGSPYATFVSATREVLYTRGGTSLEATLGIVGDRLQVQVRDSTPQETVWRARVTLTR